MTWRQIAFILAKGTAMCGLDIGAKEDLTGLVHINELVGSWYPDSNPAGSITKNSATNQRTEYGLGTQLVRSGDRVRTEWGGVFLLICCVMHSKIILNLFPFQEKNLDFFTPLALYMLHTRSVLLPKSRDSNPGFWFVAEFLVSWAYSSPQVFQDNAILLFVLTGYAS